MRRGIAILVLAGAPAFAADAWLRLTTPDFELYTTAGEKQARETARHFEQVREFFLQASPVRNLGDSPLRIFQFDKEDRYARFRPNAQTVAYFVATPGSDYIVMGDRVQDTFAPAIHEYTHLIVRHSGLKIPTWLNEGWAEVFSTLRPMGKGTAVGDLIEERMRSLAADNWLDFGTLTSVTKESPIYNENSRTGIFYAESWALAHMLFLSPEYKDNFGKFVTALHNGKSAAEAFSIAWNRTPEEVFRDLRAYFDRKRLYGIVFETRSDAREEGFTAAALPDFDSRLALADLLFASGKREEAAAEYARLEAAEPNRADLNRSIGSSALWSKEPEKARRYYTKAFDAGETDSRMCFDLAVLDREAKVPPAKIIPILERSLATRPDSTPAKVDLGLMQIEARDFSGAIATLISIPKIGPQEAPRVYCGLAYAHIQTGELDKAREDAGTCSRYAKAAPDTARAQRILTLIDARADPAVAVRPGERLQRIIGTARVLQCAPEGNRLQILVGNKLMAFDLPAPAAVELPAKPAAAFTMKCGALQPVRIGVEFAPPRSVMETSAGIVRRLEY
jgi:tetratricopeptide (TPR) repeat protein